MTINSNDIWQAAQFQAQMCEWNLQPSHFQNLKSYVWVYDSENWATLPLSDNLFYDLRVAYRLYYQQFGSYIKEHTFGLCEHIYLLNEYFGSDDLDLKFTHPKLSCMSKRQKYIYSILVKSVNNYVGAYTLMTNKQPIRVFYVVDKDETDREVTAIFIDIPATYEVDELTCYAHFGQHGVASLSWIKQKTVAASELEYANLHQELTGIYDEYELIVCSKIDKFARGNRKDYLKDIESNRLRNNGK